MKDLIEETVESRGTRLAAEVVGSGEPVTLMAHGLSGTRMDNALFAPFLPGTKILFDFRGHGQSEVPPPGSYSMDHFAADVEAVAARFGATAFAGSSLGGVAALRVMRSRPESFERFVILLPARVERSMSAYAQLMRIADLLERMPVDEVADVLLDEEAARGAFDEFPAAREFRREVIMRMNPEGVPLAIREVLDHPADEDDWSDLAEVKAPGLVLAQRGDPVHAASVAEELVRFLPNGELIMFDDPNAMVREIRTVVQRVGAFLAG